MKRLKPNPEADDLGDLLVSASIGGNSDIVRYLLSLGANPNCKANGGSAAIDRCLSHLQLRASLYRRANSQHFTFEFYRTFDVVEVLAERGAIWKPDDRRQMDYLRKALYECEPDVTVKWLELLVKHRTASEVTIRELLAAPRMKEHLAGKRWWMSHLGFKDLFPTESQIRKKYMAQNRIVSRELLARYNREELYEKVWQRPVQRLAKEFGISDVGLAKVCRKLFVPLPGRGYWARKAAGQKVGPRPALPPVQTC